jgi:hypothetical protein
LPYSCNYVVGDSPSKVRQFVLNTALSHRRPPQESTTAQLWDIVLSSHPHSQTLCLASPLLGASLTPLGGWFVTEPCFQPLLLFLPSFTDCLVLCLTPFTEAGSVSPQPPLSMLDLNSLFMLFSFVGGGGRFNLLRGCTGPCSRLGVGRGVVHDA